MARIRTVKPEFWEDDAIGLLSRDARLLFIATFNLADDEGILRWTAAYLKANAFMYDDEITETVVSELMAELTDGLFIHGYVAGRAKQRLGYIVNFRKHQNINRPTPSKLPPPPFQSGETLRMYFRRDGGMCHLCGGEVLDGYNQRPWWPTLDHLEPRSKGGNESPSNLRLAHASCNTSRRDRPVESFTGSPASRRQEAGNVPEPIRATPGASLSQALPEGADDPWACESLTESLTERLTVGREGKGGEGKGTSAPQSDARKVPAPRKTRDIIRDDVWDALLEACRVDPAGVNDLNRGAYNVAAKALRDASATPLEIRRRATAYRQRWPDTACTPTALAKHWPELAGAAPLVSTGQSYAPIPDKPDVTPESVTANAAAARAALRASKEPA